MTRSADLYALAEDLYLRHEYRAAWRLYQAGDELAVGEACEQEGEMVRPTLVVPGEVQP